MEINTFSGKGRDEEEFGGEKKLLRSEGNEHCFKIFLIEKG